MIGCRAFCTYQPFTGCGRFAPTATSPRLNANAVASSACSCERRSNCSICRTYNHPAHGRASVERATSRSLRRSVILERGWRLGTADRGASLMGYNRPGPARHTKMPSHYATHSISSPSLLAPRPRPHYVVHRYPTPCTVSIESKDGSTAMNFLRMRLMCEVMVASSTTSSASRIS